MDIRQITPRFFAAPQISPDDLPQIAATGVVRVVCNRPDEEVPPSHCAEEMEAAARAAGLDFVVQPLTHQSMTPEVIDANLLHITDCDGPVLAYCASGTRTTIAWALGMAGKMPTDDILAAARAGGYELGHLRAALDSFAKR